MDSRQEGRGSEYGKPPYAGCKRALAVGAWNAIPLPKGEGGAQRRVRGEDL
jgi:hypothetical protein